MSEEIQAVLFDMGSTLTYDFTNPGLVGQPLPGVIEVIQELHKLSMPMAVCINNAEPLFEMYQNEIIKRDPTWRRKDYSNTQEVANKLIAAMTVLGMKDVQIYVSVYDPRIESLLRSDDHPTIYPQKGAQEIATNMHRMISEAGIAASVSWFREWRKPEPDMLIQAVLDMEIFKPRILDQNLLPLLEGEHYESIYEFCRNVIYCGDMHEDSPMSNNRIMEPTDSAAARMACMKFVKAEDIKLIPQMVRDSRV